jgi:hypothetical protein
LSSRLNGNGYFRLEAREWYTDGSGLTWDVAAQAAVDSFQGSGTLTWTVVSGDGVLELPLQWQVGQGTLSHGDLLWGEADGVVPVEPPSESQSPG